jgi:hypothetical protein
MWLVPTALQLVWAGKIWRAGLQRQYLALLVFNLAAITNGVAAAALLPLDLKIGGWQIYNWAWLFVRPIIWITFFAVTVQLFMRMVESYPAIQRAGRIFLFAAFALILTVAVVLPIVMQLGIEESGSIGGRVVKANQSVYLATSSLAFALYLFRRFFYLQVVRNVDIAFLSFGLYFSGIAALLVLRGYVGPEFRESLNIWGCIWSSMCLGLGALLFKPANERVPQFAFTPQARQDMLQAANDRLEAINGQMARALAP